MRSKWSGYALKSGALSGIVALFGVAGAFPAGAQVVGRGDAIGDLPRRGYEVGRWRIGAVELRPVVRVESHYDSNVFATSRDTRDDLVFNFGPRVDISSNGTRLKLDADIEANARRYIDNTTEDALTFGLGSTAKLSLNSANTVDGKVRYDRAVESRVDPEANPLLRRPAKLDSVLGELGYVYRRNRIGIGVRGAVQRVDYRDRADDDRDLTSYNGSLRLSWALSPRLDLFVQGYGNRRDVRVLLDRSGIDRDVSTIGALAGVTVDITGRWRGDVGVGGFKAIPDGSLASFSGLALRGNLTWSPDERTEVTFKASRGDVATIRSGASGRIDTSVSLRIEQEARHNLLLHGNMGIERTSYRGNLQRRLRSVFVDVEAELLVSRRLSVFVNAGHTDRRAGSPLDRFKRTVAGVGVRVRV